MGKMVKQLEEKVTKFQTKCGKEIEKYLNEIRKKSENTEKNYRADIRRFIKYNYEKTIDTVTTEELDLLDYDSFTQYIESFEGVSNNTINRHISTIKSLYKNLKARNILNSDIAYLDLVTLLNNDGVEIDPMSIEVVERYINEAGRELHHAEVKQKLIMLAADQGLRLDELLSLTWKSFSPREDGVVISGYGKGNKKFTKKIEFWVYEDLLELRKGATLNSKVFAPLSPKNVADMMTRIKTNLGYEDREYSFHSLRKSAVTYFYRDNNGDLIKTQRYAGHSNPNTTQIYIESEEMGVTGMFSTRNNDKEAYKKLTHDELLEVIEDMSYDFVHMLNAKIQQKARNKRI